MVNLTDNDRITGPLMPAAGATELATDFPVFDADDLAVLKRASGGDWQRLTAGVDYTVSGLGQDTGATVTLAQPAAAGEEFLLVGDLKPEPELRLQYEHEIPSAGVNREFDRLWAALQETRASLGGERTGGAVVRTAPGEPGVVLPPAEDRKGRLLEFDLATGDPVAYRALTSLPQTLWLGTASDFPTTDAEGNPVQAGAVFYHTGQQLMFWWDGAAWQPFLPPGQVNVVADYAALMAAPPPASAGAHMFVLGRDTPGDGAGGMFVWEADDMSAAVSGDPLRGIFVPPSGDASGASGAWRRVWQGNSLPVEWWGAVGDDAADDHAAMQAAADWAKANTAGAWLKVTREYRITQPLDLRERNVGLYCPAGIAVIRGDFTGPDKAVVEAGTASNATRVGFYGIRGRVCICANGVVGDPIAYRDERSQQADLGGLIVPGDGTMINGKVRKLLNTGVWLTQVNNANAGLEAEIFAGYQPHAFDVPETCTFSLSAGSDQVVASEAVFTADMVGEQIFFGYAADNQWFTIAAVTDATHATLDAPSVKDAAGVKASIGYIKGTMSAGSTTLTLNRPVLTGAHVGMTVCVPRAHYKAAHGSHGLLVTRIASVTDATHAELEHPADQAITDEPIIFCPAVFVGTPRWEAGETRTTNDLRIKMQIEGYQGAGLVLNDVIYVRADVKLHGEGETYSSNPSRSMFNMIVSGCISCNINSAQIVYGWLSGVRGNIWVMGSRGELALDNIDVQRQPARGGKLVYVDDENSTAFTLVAGDILFSDVRYQPSGWTWWRQPSGTRMRVIQSGAVRANFDTQGRDALGALTLTPAVAATSGGVSIPNDSIIDLEPPVNYGTIVIASREADCDGMFYFRLNAAYGPLVRKRNVGGLIDAAGNNGTDILTGTTGTAGRLTLSSMPPDTNHPRGRLVLENRRGQTVEVNYIILAGGI